MSKPISQAALEAIAGDIGRTIAGAVKEAAALEGSPPIGFAFFVFDFGEKGSMAYAANARRHDVVALLEELAAQLRAEGN